jgi:hypothetical protein
MIMKWHNPLTAIAFVCMACGLGVVTPQSSHANLVSYSGNVQLVAPPVTVRRDKFESNQFIRVFQEREAQELRSGVRGDACVPGLYDRNAGLVPHWIAAGTVVNSYLIHQDTTKNAGVITMTGSLTFSEDILGVIVRKHRLRLSDPLLRAQGTLYPQGKKVWRGLELRPLHDWFTISNDMRTISFSIRTNRALDQIRVITAATPIPAPGVAAILALAAIAPRRRRSA